MPVAKARPVKGLSTDSNSLGADSGSAAGTFASACVNNSLVEGVGEGAGACPKLGGVVPGTVGVAPRLTSAPSETASTPVFGSPRLRSEGHTSEPQSLMSISYDGICLEKKQHT